MQLSGQTVVITGGGGRIGSALAEAVVVAGGAANVADQDAGLARRRVAEIQKRHPSAKVEAVQLDIGSERSLKKCLRSVAGRYGRVDGWVNCAYPRNKRYGARFEHVKLADFCENVDLHLGGYFLASQQAAIFFRDQGGGTIVNIASIYGVMAPRFEVYDGTNMTMPVEYAAIKAAIVHLTKYMAKYCKDWRVRVNCVSPGGVEAGQPASFVEKYNALSLSKGLLAASDVTGAVVFLLSKDSEFINGQNLVVDDGFSL